MDRLIFVFGRVFDLAPDEAGLSCPALGFRNSFRRVAETAAQDCDGLKSKTGDDPCRTGGEYVSDNEGAGASMQRVEQFSYCSLARAYPTASHQ